jgi:hypothetical protein
MIMKRAVTVVVVFALVAAALLYAAAAGWLGATQRGGTIVGAARAPSVAQASAASERSVAPPDAPPERQILFGDLHVHSIFSTDANLMSLPMMQGDGPHPPADACDFARYCSRLDFFSMNDHAEALTPQRWSDTRDSIRQCNALADPQNPDLVAFLGYEWTQMSQQDAANHFGHKNVVFRDTEEGKVPVRAIAARNPGISLDAFVPPLRQRLGMPLLDPSHMKSYLDFNRFSMEMLDVPSCADGVDTRELPENCRESAATPAELFRKLDEGGYASIVIPHGNTWGIYTAMNSTWDKQLAGDMQDPARQFLVEIYSGHGNSEEYRTWTPALRTDSGLTCPEPTDEYLPVCWQAGEIIRGRCLAGGADAAECEQRAAEARQRAVGAGTGNEFGVAAGADVTEWLDSGQCRDCFLPAFNYRPGGSTQYALAIGNFDGQGAAPRRFRFGVIASSDVHSARPGTGYKEFARIPMTEARGPGREGVLEAIRDYDGPRLDRARTPEEMTRDMRNLLFTVMERQSSFWLTGGLAAVHADSRRREDIWAALQRKEVYGTSGPRILLWFDLLDRAGGQRVAPMGSERNQSDIPHFRVTAAGSFEQKPGCPQDSIDALGAERLANLCLGECYFPGDKRRPISRVEVVRIRPQVVAGEPVQGLIEDPWRVMPCPPGSEACTVEFEDEEFPGSGREALYYVRAIEAPSLAVNADPLRCERDADGQCVRVNPCVGDFRTPKSEDCLAPTEERAWSSPIFLDPAPL